MKRKIVALHCGTFIFKTYFFRYFHFIPVDYFIIDQAFVSILHALFVRKTEKGWTVEGIIDLARPFFSSDKLIWPAGQDPGITENEFRKINPEFILRPMKIPEDAVRIRILNGRIEIIGENDSDWIVCEGRQQEVQVQRIIEVFEEI